MWSSIFKSKRNSQQTTTYADDLDIRKPSHVDGSIHTVMYEYEQIIYWTMLSI